MKPCLVCDPVRVGVVADRCDAGERRGRLPRRGRARARSPSSSTPAGAADVLGYPERTREVVSAPAGQHAQRRSAPERPGERSDEPVAAERDDRLAAPGGRERGLGRVRDVLRLDDVDLGAARPSAAPRTAGQQPQGLAARRARVHHDREAAALAHAGGRSATW